MFMFADIACEVLQAMRRGVCGSAHAGLAQVVMPISRTAWRRFGARGQTADVAGVPTQQVDADRW